MQKFIQTAIIFSDQFTVKFGKRFAEFMILIACLRSLIVTNLLRLLKSLTCGDALVKQIVEIKKHNKRDTEGRRQQGMGN